MSQSISLSKPHPPPPRTGARRACLPRLTMLILLGAAATCSALADVLLRICAGTTCGVGSGRTRRHLLAASDRCQLLLQPQQHLRLPLCPLTRQKPRFLPVPRQPRHPPAQPVCWLQTRRSRQLQPSQPQPPLMQPPYPNGPVSLFAASTRALQSGQKTHPSAPSPDCMSTRLGAVQRTGQLGLSTQLLWTSWVRRIALKQFSDSVPQRGRHSISRVARRRASTGSGFTMNASGGERTTDRLPTQWMSRSVLDQSPSRRSAPPRLLGGQIGLQRSIARRTPSGTAPKRRMSASGLVLPNARRQARPSLKTTCTQVV